MTTPDANAASLGELAARYGLISEKERAEMSRTLEADARAGRPTSLARTLLQRGVPRGTLERVLGTGAGLAVVRCDGCGFEFPMPSFQGREALTCERCGVLTIGFQAFGDPASAEAVGSSTADFPQVLIPVPAAGAEPLSDAETTAQFDMLITPMQGLKAPFDSVEFDPHGPTVLPGAGLLQPPAALPAAQGAFDPYGPTAPPARTLPPQPPTLSIGEAAFDPYGPTVPPVLSTPRAPTPPSAPAFDAAGPTDPPAAEMLFDPNGPTILPTPVAPIPLNTPLPPLPNLADLPGLGETVAANDLPPPTELPLEGPSPSGRSTATSRRRRPAPTTGKLAVPAPPPLWPWVAALTFLSLVALAEIVVHVLI